MADTLSRRSFLAAAAATPGLVVSDRIAQFLPPPERVQIVAAADSFVVPPPIYSAEEIKQIQSQGKNIQLTVPANTDELNRLLPEVDVI
ncbi:MAG: twin-arginine translocation signal domain-containing protein, partial [Thermoguttaceae bacterium]